MPNIPIQGKTPWSAFPRSAPGYVTQAELPFFCYHRTKLMTSQSNPTSTCVLLFSGGRDSTLAAIRLARSFSRIVLVTVKSPYMTGLNILNSRLEELKGILSVRCDWMLVPEKRLPRDQASSEDLGCIGCHFAYFASGYSVARQFSCDSIACGFVAYQNSWVEQTPYAVERLRALMSEYGSTLLLPVAELRSKAEVQAELATYGVTKDSLELNAVNRKLTRASSRVRLKRPSTRESRPCAWPWEKSSGLNVPCKRSLCQEKTHEPVGNGKRSHDRPGVACICYSFLRALG